jgi:hypothetical protein
MVAPITSTVEYLNVPATIGGFSTFSFMQTRSLRKQAKPIDRVLPYQNQIRQLLKVAYDGRYVGGADTLSHVPEPQYTSGWNFVNNKAYDKLREQVQHADMGVNLVEFHQASTMLGKRGSEVLSLAYLLARRRFADAGRVLQCSFYDGKPPRRNRSKYRLPNLPKANISLSNLWLEWHFGWSPLISDCQAAAKVITEPLPWFKIRGSAETFERFEQHDVLPGGSLKRDKVIVTRIRARQGTYVEATNPNLAMAGQLGLLNPAALLWEIVPFSFVADWFVNVGDWLQGFTDFAGMTLRYQYTSWHYWTFYTYSEQAPGGSGVPPSSGMIHGKALNVGRTASLTAPILSVRPLKLPGLSRSATIWSLVSQIVQRR